MSCIAVLPVRLNSQRLPQKALLRESGKFLFQHTYENASRAEKISKVVIATDSPEIAAAAKSFGVEVMMTSPTHPCGTDRVREVASRSPEATQFLNIQGDYPEIRPQDIDLLVETLNRPGADAATLVTPFLAGEDPADPHLVKVVADKNGRALYFSRSPIPHGFQGRKVSYTRHVGIYGFQRKTLEAFGSLPQSALELSEGLEQLRLLENGFTMMLASTDSPAHGIETAADYQKFLGRLGHRTGARS